MFSSIVNVAVDSFFRIFFFLIGCRWKSLDVVGVACKLLIFLTLAVRGLLSCVCTMLNYRKLLP